MHGINLATNDVNRDGNPPPPKRPRKSFGPSRPKFTGSQQLPTVETFLSNRSYCGESPLHYQLAPTTSSATVTDPVVESSDNVATPEDGQRTLHLLEPQFSTIEQLENPPDGVGQSYQVETYCSNEASSVQPRPVSGNGEVLDLLLDLESSINECQNETTCVPVGDNFVAEESDSRQFEYLQCYVDENAPVEGQDVQTNPVEGFPTYMVLFDGPGNTYNGDLSCAWLSNDSCCESIVNTINEVADDAAAGHPVDCSGPRHNTPEEDDSRELTNADESSAETGGHLTYVLDESEKERRKGSVAEKWNRNQKNESKNNVESIQWTDSEVEILTTNIKSCAELYNSTPEDIIHKWDKSRRGDFYKIVSTGLDRPLFSIYRKAQRLFDKSPLKKGKFSEEELETLRELHDKFGSDWVKIGKIMSRAPDCVRGKFRVLRKPCENSGYWSKAEEDALIKAVKNQTGGYNETSRINWNSVRAAVKTRSAKQCREKWILSLKWKMSGSVKWTAEDSLLLIEKLSACGASHEDQVDWESLANDWLSVRSPQWLRRHWVVYLKKLINAGEKLSFSDSLIKLQTFFYECNQLFASGLTLCEDEMLSQLDLSREMDKRACVDFLLNRMDYGDHFLGENSEVALEELVTTDEVH